VKQFSLLSFLFRVHLSYRPRRALIVGFMSKSRVHYLLTKQQRQRVKAEARRQGDVSESAIIRALIDRHLPDVKTGKKVEAIS
jgi:hypothetical protein